MIEFGRERSAGHKICANCFCIVLLKSICISFCMSDINERGII